MCISLVINTLPENNVCVMLRKTFGKYELALTHGTFWLLHRVRWMCETSAGKIAGLAFET